jgi:hypothetical protein
MSVLGIDNIVYSSIDVKSTDPVDKRMYIDSITNSNLLELFGNNGVYGIHNAVLFNRATKHYHYYTGVAGSLDILNPANWSEVISTGDSKFVSWNNSAVYTIGQQVYDPSTLLSGVQFYIAKVAETTAGLSPYLSSDEWFCVNANGSTRQTATVTVDNTLTSTSFSVNYSSIYLPSLPTVSIYGYFSGGLRPINCGYSINAGSSVINFSLTGDLSDLNNVSGNVVVVLT